MMKGKSKQLVLLAVVITVWGIVIYRFMDFSVGGKEQLTSIKLNSENPQNSIVSTYRFALNYADPFLKGQRLSPPVEDLEPPKKEVRPQKSFRLVPSISFQGVVHGEKPTGILMVEGRIYMVNKGSQIGDLEVLNVHEKSIELHFAPLDSLLLIGK